MTQISWSSRTTPASESPEMRFPLCLEYRATLIFARRSISASRRKRSLSRRASARPTAVFPVPMKPLMNTRAGFMLTL